MLRPVKISAELLSEIVREGWVCGEVSCVKGVPGGAVLRAVEVVGPDVETTTSVVLWFSYDAWDTREPVNVEYECGEEAKRSA